MKSEYDSEKARINTVCAVFLLSVFLLLPHKLFAASTQWIAPQRVQSMMREGNGLWLIDIRGKSSFDSSHAEGAVNISKESIASKKFPKQKILVLMDDSLGLKEAREAAAQLIKNGQQKVFILEGGLPAWKREKLPLAGRGGETDFRTVSFDELKWAQANNIPLRIIDFRDKAEQAKVGISNAELLDSNESLQKRLIQTAELLSRNTTGSIAFKMEKPATVILIFPSGIDALPLLKQNANLLQGDVRYLEGGLLAWASNPDKEMKTVGKCPTCPGDTRGGK